MSRKSIHSLKLGNKKKTKLIYELDVKKSSTNLGHLRNVMYVFTLFLDYYNQKISKKATHNYIKIDDKKVNETLKKDAFFISIATVPLNNHPFVAYGYYNNTSFKILIPLGNQPGQVNIRHVKPMVNKMKSIDKLALHHLLRSTLTIREVNLFKYTKKLINTPDSIFNCSNIKACQESIIKIHKMDIPYNQQTELMNAVYGKIKEIIFAHLKKYFKLLKIHKFNEAETYLKTQFNNIYYNTKGIMGHLLIFIDVYKLIETIKKNI